MAAPDFQAIVKGSSWQGPSVTVDRASRSDFLIGARAGGLFVGAVAAATILSRVQGGGRGARRRQR